MIYKLSFSYYYNTGDGLLSRHTYRFTNDLRIVIFFFLSKHSFFEQCRPSIIVVYKIVGKKKIRGKKQKTKKNNITI